MWDPAVLFYPMYITILFQNVIIYSFAQSHTKLRIIKAHNPGLKRTSVFKYTLLN